MTKLAPLASGTAGGVLLCPRLHFVASVIYDVVYPGPELAPVSFEEAERLETVYYRQVVEAALLARPALTDRVEQLGLICCDCFAP